MNLGPEKSKIVQFVMKNRKPKLILEIGGYCGYSALVFAHFSGAEVHTIEIAKKYADIAHKIHTHAGLGNKIKIHVGTVQTSFDYIKSSGPFDIIFIDHIKNEYLNDLKRLYNYGVIKVGTVVIGDNIIYPGSPDYL